MIFNLNCAAKSNLYPGVEKAIIETINNHNWQASNWAGRAAHSRLLEDIDKIAAMFNVPATSLAFFSSASEAFCELSKVINFRLKCSSIEHQALKQISDIITHDGDQINAGSYHNHELGIAVNGSANIKVLDGTADLMRPTLADHTVYSCGKHGALPMGLIVSAKPVAGLFYRLDPIKIAALAASCEWQQSMFGVGRADGFASIKKIFSDACSQFGQVIEGSAPRVLSYIADHNSELIIELGEQLGLVLSGGSACNSGNPEPNRSGSILYGPDVSKRIIRLSWDHTWTPASASEAANKLTQLHAQLKEM